MPSSNLARPQNRNEVSIDGNVVYKYLMDGDIESLEKIYNYVIFNRSDKISQSQARKILDLFKELKEEVEYAGENIEQIKMKFLENLVKILIFLEYQKKRGLIKVSQDNRYPKDFIFYLEEATKKVLNELPRNRNLDKNMIKEIAKRYDVLAEIYVVANYNKQKL